MLLMMRRDLDELEVLKEVKDLNLTGLNLTSGIPNWFHLSQ